MSYELNEKQRAEIEEAVNKIFNYLDDEIAYSDLLETVMCALSEYATLAELNRYVASMDLPVESVPSDKLVELFQELPQLIRLLRPFAKVMGQLYGYKTLTLEEK